MKIPINKEVINERLHIIEQTLEKLKELQKLSIKDFSEGDNFAIAEHHLRRALEAVFDIGTHILSRIPGVKPRSYKEIPKLLAEKDVIPKDFGQDKLLPMAGYRNRLIHFYPEITAEEIYNIIKQDLPDFYAYCRLIIDYVKLK